MEQRGTLGSLGKRLAKLAEKKIQKGIDYLDSQAKVHYNPNPPSSYSAPSYNNPNPPAYHPTPSHNSDNTPSHSYQQHNHQSQYLQPFQSASPHTPFSEHFPDSQTPSSAYHPTPSHNSDNTPSHSYQQQNHQSQYHSFQFAPPPTPFSEPFPDSQTTGSATSQSQSASYQPSIEPLPNAQGPIITLELLNQMQARIPSAIKSLGSPAVTEARKGISRLLSSTYADIELFGNQLKTSNIAAVEPKWNDIDDLHPCFAITYVQQPAQGRYKFSHSQWSNFHEAVKAIAHAGVRTFRVWLDQCLWLRDASQPNWAHTGILPYVLWPVIALGAKTPGAERTIDSYHRMWPFVEQIAALWGMGLVIASEYRDKSLQSGVRPWLSYNTRVRTEPDQDIMILLLNIFHGAADMLETGWQEDVRELKEMAQANVMYANEQVIIGTDWKQRFQSIDPLASCTAVDNIRMSIQSEFRGGVNTYLDGSRALKSRGWNGVREWLSGNDGPLVVSERDVKRISFGMDKYNIITNAAFSEYQLLHLGSSTQSLWLLVAMQGSSSNFSRGRVAWTKILTGIGSCNLVKITKNNDVKGLQQILQEQLNNYDLRITSAEKVNLAIEWL